MNRFPFALTGIVALLLLALPACQQMKQAAREAVQAAGGTLSEGQFDELEEEVRALLKKQLRPEFLNRIDETIMFRMLGREEIAGIVELQFERLAQIAQKNHHLTLTLTDEANGWLAERGFDPVFGARPLKRVMQRQVSNPLAEQVLSGDVPDGARVEVGVAERGDALAFTVTDAPVGAEEATPAEEEEAAEPVAA
jgi:ATP-dependent Clp protease ATP-binding subunit ClpB